MNIEEANKLYFYFENELKKIFPSLEFGHSSISSINQEANSLSYEFSVSQNSINNTSYGNSIGKKFIHYTSIEAFSEILNSMELRLFNLNNMNDPFEFNFLLKEFDLKLEPKEIDSYKKKLFVSSLCKYDERDEDDFNLWRLYGSEGRGVAIVFELKNDINDWRNFLIGNVIYGKDNIESERIISAIKIANKYIDKGLDRIPKMLLLLLLHHKNKIWSIENECRLSTFFDFNDFFLESNDFDNPLVEGSLRGYIKPNGIVTNSISFPLIEKLRKNFRYDINKFEQYAKSIPQISISKVILGYQYEDNFLEKFKHFCIKTYSHKFNSFFKIEMSKFSSWTR